MGINDFRLRLVGERFENRDGTSRQEELEQCSVGEPVTLERETDNPVDPGAVAVFSARGRQIGYLGADRATFIRGKIDRGFDLRAIIAQLRKRPGMPISAVLALNLDGEDPEV